MKYSESDIQALKAQEAKDLCIQLLHKLEARTEGPISAGEVQLQELQYELEIKQAETADNRQRETHQERMKELELEIERKKSEFAAAEKKSDEVHSRQVQVIEQVAQSQERLSIALDRATREHNVKLQIMQTEHETKRQALTNRTRRTDRRTRRIQIAKLETEIA